MNVILVHGIFESGRLFNALAKRLRCRHHTCFVPQLKPNDARHGIADLSYRLVEYIDSNLNKQEHFVLIAFSMGCLVSQYYLQMLNGNERCDGFFAISAPFKGTQLAYLLYGQGARDLRPDSDFIKSLTDTESTLQGIPIHTYRTPYDLMIVPSKSSQWALAENHITKAFFHDSMPKNEFVMNHICERLENYY